MLCCGGINAAAEVAVLTVPLLYLLTRARGPRRRRLLGWWLGCVALVEFWWAVPVVLMAKYVFSFMPFTESSAATTGVTSLTNILRGMADWTAFIPVDGHPWWPAGFALANTPWLIAATACTAGLGIVGLLLRRRCPERTFWLITLLLGVAIMSSGHVSAISGPLGPAMQHLFDGLLAPLRNIHKFDAMVRLPVCFGLMHLLTLRLVKVRQRQAMGVAVSCVVALTLVPVVHPGLVARGSFEAIPTYWRQAMSWLNQHTTDEQSVLAVPGSRWGEYTWGRPLDEPMQPLLTVHWAGEQIVPSGSDGLARLYEAIDDRMTSGEGSRGLSDLLRRLGVKYLLVRNDLERDTLRGAWPARVHQALDASPGLKQIKYFGPLTGEPDTGNATTWLDQPYPALEIYQVKGADPVAGTVSSKAPLRVTGGPEALLTLADEGLLAGDRPVLLDGDPGADKVPIKDTVVTDTLRRREVDFSAMRQNVSPTMTAHQKYQGNGPAHDYTDPSWAPYTSHAAYSGVTNVTASSSAADVTAPPAGRQQGEYPYAAFDRDARTAWVSAGWHGSVGQWIKARFAAPLPLHSISVRFMQNSYLGPPVSQVAIQTQHGTVHDAVTNGTSPQTLRTPPGRTTWLKITVTKLAWQPKTKLGARVGISEIDVPGLLTARSIVTPKLADPGPGHGDPTVVLTANRKATPGCMRGSKEWVCSGTLRSLGEDGNTFDRTFHEPVRARRVITGSALLDNLGTVEKLTTFPGQYPKVHASSTMLNEPELLGRSAMDGDRTTTWIPNPFDRKPSLAIDLGHKHTISRIRLQTPAGLGDTPPIQVTVVGGGQLRGGYVGADGWLTFKPIHARKLILRFGTSPAAHLQISEVTIPGVTPLGPPPDIKIATTCGFGPNLDVDGYPVKTKITGGTIADVLHGRPVSFTTCQPVTLPAGTNRVQVPPTSPFRIDAMVIGPRHHATVPATDTHLRLVPIVTWGAQRRQLHVATDGPAYIVVNENANSGWHATANGQRLTPVTLDGWKQGFILPGRTYATVTLTYAPDTTYRLSLLLGGLLVLLVVAFALVRPGRRGVATAALPPAPPGTLGRRAVWVGSALLALWVGGLLGLAVLALVLALIDRARTLLARGDPLTPAVRRACRGMALSWPPGLLLALAGLSLAIGTHLGDDGQVAFSGPLRDVLAQLLCLPVLAAMCAALLHAGPEPASDVDQATEPATEPETDTTSTAAVPAASVASRPAPDADAVGPDVPGASAPAEPSRQPVRVGADPYGASVVGVDPADLAAEDPAIDAEAGEQAQPADPPTPAPAPEPTAEDAGQRIARVGDGGASVVGVDDDDLAVLGEDEPPRRPVGRWFGRRRDRR